MMSHLFASLAKEKHKEDCEKHGDPAYYVFYVYW